MGIVSMLVGTYLVTTKLGRKWTQSISLIIAGACLYLFLLAHSYATIMLSSSGFYFFLLMAYGAQYTITPESYPTDVRNTGLGLCSTINRVAMLIAPLISGSLIDQCGLDLGGYIAIVLYSVSLFVAGGLGMLLKETKGANIELGIE
jgi:putative MFS transporter